VRLLIPPDILKRLVAPADVKRLIPPLAVRRLIAPEDVKRLVPVVVAAVVGAAVLLCPVPPPPAGASGAWSSTPPDARQPRGRRTPAPQAMVYVAGEVARPGVYPVRPEARTRDALALAGGTRPDADLVAVNLAAHVRDGDEIVVPARGAAGAPGNAAGRRGHGRGRRSGGPRRSGAADQIGAAVSGRRHGPHRRRRYDELPPAEVDINTADADTLASIPGVGEGLAKRIIAFRDQNGAFASVDELLDVAGITEHRLDAMLPYVVAR
jgi:competence protein ComEA